MTKLSCLLGLSFALTTSLSLAASPVELANPLMGTDNPNGFSHGNTLPEVALPFPMNAWCAYTQPQRDSFYYAYRQTKIRGIRQTHQPSPWMGDYANFALMPARGRLVVNEVDRASEFTHENEISQPGYYKVRLDTWNAIAEVTPTERAARFRFTYEQGNDGFVVLDVFRGANCMVEIIPAERKIIGIARNNRGGVPEDGSFGSYFVIVFDQPFTSYGVWTGASGGGRGNNREPEAPEIIKTNETQVIGPHVGAFLRFDTGANKVIGCKVASSYISHAQAQLNLQREIGDADFDTIHKRADQKWNDAFSRVMVEGGSDEQTRTFYSCFYRALLFPEKFHEVNEEGKTVHYSPYDGKVHDGVLYTDSGFWDTFRAAHPLYTLLFPEVSAEIMQSLLNTYDESGWLPEWPSPGHRGIMIGENSFSLLADAWVKGVTNFNAEKAVEAMVHDANNSHPSISAVGRDGVKFYNEIGYLPYDNQDRRGPKSFTEASAKTLEFAYDDFCAAKLADAIGKKDVAATFARHAMNYTNLFDPKIGFVRERKADGSWDEPFYPEQWGGGFTEGCSWHWTWCVFQDIPGLMELMGGEKAFGDKLDAVFTAPDTVKVGTYGGMIHEMTEMVAAGMGQYAHGNEPVHHMIYLYNYAGRPWRTQIKVRQVMSQLYQPTPDGYCGDEDTGQMSAWYMFSALGFYPVCPGDTAYLIGSPLFKFAMLNLPNGKQFSIVGHNNGPQEYYIRGATLNGEALQRTYIRHNEIVRGGELGFQMSSQPNYKWGISPESRPHSALRDLTGAQ